MANQIKRLKYFMNAANAEYDVEFRNENGWSVYLLIGKRMYDIWHNRINEDDYIKKWTGK